MKRGSMESWVRGRMEAWNHGLMEPCNGILEIVEGCARIEGIATKAEAPEECSAGGGCIAVAMVLLQGLCRGGLLGQPAWGWFNNS